MHASVVNSDEQCLTVPHIEFLEVDYDSSAVGGTDDLFRWSATSGKCRVMCFNPKSNVTLATMDSSETLAVVNAWIEQMQQLGPQYDWVQIFENKGTVVGCSNPHPHCQIWAGNFLPNEPATMHRTQLAYYNKHGRPMLMDYLKRELMVNERIVYHNNDWAVLVPFWAMWPYETILLPKRHITRITGLNDQEKTSLCDAMKQLLVRYDNLFRCSFPYSMGWRGAPTGTYSNDNCDHWQLHAVYLPPLLRSSTVKKFMAGYELVCEPQRDITPEVAAKSLAGLPNKHYGE